MTCSRSLRLTRQNAGSPTGYCLLVVAVTPASPGVAPTLAVTAPDQYGATIDDFTFYR